MTSRQTTVALGVMTLVIALAGTTWAQQTAADRLKAMSGDLDALEAKTKEKLRPPFEFLRTMVPPFDVLPYIKKHHWFTLNLEMVANASDYQGELRTAPEVGGRPQIRLLDMPQAMIFSRSARLAKEQKTRLGMEIMLPDYIKELNLELTRPELIRPDGITSAQLLKLEPHQMVIPILAIDPSRYEGWKRMLATLPGSGSREQGPEMERERYYRLSLPLTDRPILSPTALSWTTISHVVWDGMLPGSIPSAQQEAMIDWLHFGGQIVIVAAGPGTVAPLEESFLGPYLPATASGKNASLTETDLKTLARTYPPPFWTSQAEDPLDMPGVRRNLEAPIPPRYKPPVAIRPAPGRPLFVAGLEPKPGASVIPLGDPGNHPLAIEWRIGRGRVLMLSVNPNDPSLAAWPGLDTLVRRVLLRRVEEEPTSGDPNHVYQFLGAPNLTWFRLLSRDLSTQVLENDNPDEPNSPLNRDPVAAWVDGWPESLPVLCREAIEEASGISIPGPNFVLKVILGYILVLVPLNWLFCRYVIRRKEWAWAAVPFLALGFAISVERAAAYDTGFDSICSEIDVIEVQGGYPRAHVSRFAAVYSTGRDKYRISYPSDPTALALPLNQQRSLRGEDYSTAVFESFPVPTLAEFQVQPRTLATFRSEALSDLKGSISLVGDRQTGKIENFTAMDLHNAVLIDTSDDSRIELGTLGAGETFNLNGSNTPSKAKPAAVSWTDINPLLETLEDYRWKIPPEAGELRLVGWVADTHPGQVFEPKLDETRGFRLVVVHLRYDPLPEPDSYAYYH